MKAIKAITAAILVSSVSFGALAAEEITKEEAAKYTKIGTEAPRQKPHRQWMLKKSCLSWQMRKAVNIT